VCMAATLGGVMRAPLTASIFAFGLTHDSNALLPLLATSAVAYGFTVLTMRRSILTEKIARRGYHIYREYGIDPLERHSVEEVMTREVRSIDAAMPVTQALFEHFGEGQAHRAFPVLRNGAVIGVADRAMLAARSTRDPIATRCRSRSTRWKTGSASCRCTGCGGPPSAASRWASAATCSRARWAWATT